MSFLLSKKKKTLIYVKVTTMDADLDAIPIEADCSGRDLFNMVCRIIGLREIWYFGLQHKNKKGHWCWLQLDKKILNQGVVRQSNGSYCFLFLVKFYPEVIEEELIQDLTRHLFFVQIKQSILSKDLYCQPEAAVLLASFAVQAMYGDYSEDIELELDKLLPESVIDQYEMTSEMWKERIINWWMNNGGLTVEEAEMEYLRVAQDLSMYGIQYYPIYNQKDTDLLLGISAQGLGIYENSNRMSPRPFFPWSEIKNIHFKNKLFTIKVMDKSKIKFRAQETSDMVRTTEETSKLIAEKAKISEEEALELSKRANQAEAEVQRVKMSQIEAEEMKIALQRKVRDAELLAHRLMQESQVGNSTRMSTGNEEFLIPFWNYAAQNLSLQQQNFIGRLGNPPEINPTPLGEAAAEGDVQFINEDDEILPGYYSTQFFNDELADLKAQISQSNEEYFQRNKDFREKLADFRREMDSLKLDDRQTENDRIHEANVQNGWDKYSTLRKSGSGSSKSRVRVFNEL
ncbi:hypothetical protein FO519_007380 [Halicephalobus sp. NKZ332]|nr:hypothetical protein FO519_007380 [Halicephalobus sp. NKZ332]